MIKEQYPVIVFFLLNLSLFAQDNIVFSGLKWPVGLEIRDNILFVAEADSNRISYIDFNNLNPEICIIIDNLGRPNYLEVYNNYLYFSGFEDGLISRVNLLSLNSLKEIVISNLN